AGELEANPIEGRGIGGVRGRGGDWRGRAGGRSGEDLRGRRKRRFTSYRRKRDSTTDPRGDCVHDLQLNRGTSRSEGDPIPILERYLTVNSLIVHPGPVSAVQVTNVPAPGIEEE